MHTQGTKDGAKSAIHGASSAAVTAGCSCAFEVIARQRTEENLSRMMKFNTHTHISYNLLLLLVSIKNRISLDSHTQLCQMAPAWQQGAS